MVNLIVNFLTFIYFNIINTFFSINDVTLILYK